jgi:hypothetical protein
MNTDGIWDGPQPPTYWDVPDGHHCQYGRLHGKARRSSPRNYRLDLDAGLGGILFPTLGEILALPVAAAVSQAARFSWKERYRVDIADHIVEALEKARTVSDALQFGYTFDLEYARFRSGPGR